jgi:hypothetical protein
VGTSDRFVYVICGFFVGLALRAASSQLASKAATAPAARHRKIIIDRAQDWSKAMHSIDPAGPSTNQVVALFGDHVISFSLSQSATFADLAARLDQLRQRHIGMPTAIYLKVAFPGPALLRL